MNSFEEYLINNRILESLHDLYSKGIDPGISLTDIKENYYNSLIILRNSKIDLILND